MSVEPLRSRLILPWLPPGIGPSLDLEELAEADRALAAERNRLEALLGAHVAAYARGARGRSNAVCRTYRAARLTAEQVACLDAAERLFPDVVFVAYAAPLRTFSATLPAGEPSRRYAR